jgi:hypothetical protein
MMKPSASFTRQSTQQSKAKEERKNKERRRPKSAAQALSLCENPKWIIKALKKNTKLCSRSSHQLLIETYQKRKGKARKRESEKKSAVYVHGTNSES